MDKNYENNLMPVYFHPSNSMLITFVSWESTWDMKGEGEWKSFLIGRNSQQKQLLQETLFVMTQSLWAIVYLCQVDISQIEFQLILAM